MDRIKLIIQSGILKVKTLAESFVTLTGIKGVKDNGGSINNGILNATIQELYENSQWFTDNATHILLSGQRANLLQTGMYKIGDGVTELQNLSFLGNMTTIQDGLTSGGEISVVGDDITVAPAGWLISPNVYGTLVNTDFLNITLSSAGNQRYIGFYGNTSNAIVKVEGAEAAIASYPTQPANTIIVGFVLVGDAVIDTQPDLTGFEEKVNKVNTVVGNETDADKYPNIPAIIAYLQAVYNLQQVTNNGSTTTNTVSVISSGANQEKVKVFGSDLQNKVVLGTDSFNGGQAKFYDSSESETVTIRGESGRIEAFEYNLPTETASRITVLDSGKTLRSGSISESDIATISYVDGLVAGLLDDRGSYDASVNLFPSSGGSGTAGAILKGDIWYISVAGTLGGSAVTIGDSVRALADAPGQTATNWSILETNIGYVPENISNKTGTVAGNESSTTLYLHVKGFYDYLVSLVWMTSQMWGTWINGLTSKTTPVDADQVVLMDSADSNNSKKLSWANVKATLASTFFLDATSSIQTQFDKIRAYIELGQTGAVTFSPIDGETRFYGMLTAGIPATAASARALIITNNIVVKEVSVSTWVNTTIGSNEAVSIYLEEYSGTAAATLVNSTLITSSYTLDNASKQNSLNITGLNISVSAGNFIIFKVVFPNFTTNPTNMWTVFLLSVKQS